MEKVGKHYQPVCVCIEVGLGLGKTRESEAHRFHSLRLGKVTIAEEHSGYDAICKRSSVIVTGRHHHII